MKKNRQYYLSYLSLLFMLLNSFVFCQVTPVANDPNISSVDAYYKINNYDQIIDGEYMIVKGTRAANNSTQIVVFGENPLLSTSVAVLPSTLLNVPYITQTFNESRLKWNILKRAENAYTLQNVYNQSYLQIYDVFGALNLGFETNYSNSNIMKWDLRDNLIRNIGRNRYLYLDGNNFKFKSSASNSEIDLFKKFKLDNFEDMSGYEGESFIFDANALPQEGGGSIEYFITSGRELATIDSNTKKITFLNAGVIKVLANVSSSDHVPSYSKEITINIYSSVTCFNENLDNFNTSSINFPSTSNVSLVNPNNSYIKSIRLESNGVMLSKQLEEVSGTVNVELNIAGYSNSSLNNRRPKVKLTILNPNGTIFYSGEKTLTRRSSSSNNINLSDFKLESYAFINVPHRSFLKIETVNQYDTKLWIKDVRIQCNEPEETIWQYQRWSKGRPNKNSKAIIRENFNDNVIAKDLKIETDLVVPSGNYFRIYENLDVNFNDLIFEKGSYLYLDSNNKVLNGDIRFKTSITSYMYSSRIYSTPVFANYSNTPLQKIRGSINENAFTTTDVNLFKVEKVNGWANYEGNNFVNGRSVAIRRNTGPKYNSNDANILNPERVNSEFKGVPKIDNIPFDVENGTYTLGNPYTTPLDINKFLTENTSVVKNILIWRDDNPYDFNVRNYKYPNQYWYECSLAGCVNALHYESIDVGVGFLAQTLDYNGIKRIVIRPTQRTLLQSGLVQNNRSQNINSRYILTLNQDDKNYKNILISYIDGASDEHDDHYDVETEQGDYANLVIKNNEKLYSIISKSQNAINSDIINLSLTIVDSGNYQISLKDFEGDFSNNLSIYIKDNLTNNIVNLSDDGSYSFYSESGLFEDRFEILYRNDILNIEDFKIDNDLILYSRNDDVFVKSLKKIKSYRIYDQLGRLNYSSKDIMENNFRISSNFKKISIYVFEMEDGSFINKKYYN